MTTILKEPIYDYVTGVSLTHGSPRQRMLTFVATSSETRKNAEGCSCSGASITLNNHVHRFTC